MSWHKISTKYLSQSHHQIVDGYVRDVEKLKLYSLVPIPITSWILANTYFVEAFPNIIDKMKQSLHDKEKIKIMSDMTKLLDMQEDWDSQILKILGLIAFYFI